ncbi:MAG: FAD-binding oxidoreductase [Methylovulum sp.]|nr:FAD-binding oxidoreductase [Methylovulum sp.]
MLNITCGESNVACLANETVLDALLKANIPIPYGCRQGVCQSCLMRSLDVTPPVAAQIGIKDTLQKQNYFLACCCHPEQDMTVSLPDQQDTWFEASVIQKQQLSPEIIRLTLQYNAELSFFAGQFVNLQRLDGLTRSYSIANSSRHEKILEFHIRRLPNGQFSSWAHDELQPGTTLTLTEARGSCHYLPGRAQQPLLLIGTGSGLAPLYGIIHDALAQGHAGSIHLYHGSRNSEGLYLIDEMQELAKQYANFNYTASVSGACATETGFAQGRAHELALNAVQSLKGWRVYLCGHPEMVNQSKRMAYIKGASLGDIYADAFLTLPH